MSSNDSKQPDKTGMKKLSLDNWDKPDEISELLPENARANTENILSPQLSENVPSEIRDLYESARAIMLYGYYYNPLYKQGLEQFFRVGEAALWHKMSFLSETPLSKEVGFQRLMNMLRNRGVINEKSYNTWETIRVLRNSSSHAKERSLIPAETCIQVLIKLTTEINALFQNAPIGSTKIN